MDENINNATQIASSRFVSWLRERRFDCIANEYPSYADYRTLILLKLQNFSNLLADFKFELEELLFRSISKNKCFEFSSRDSESANFLELDLLLDKYYHCSINELIGENVNVSFYVDENRASIEQSAFIDGVLMYTTILDETFNQMEK